jgi:hypothetical protein
MSDTDWPAGKTFGELTPAQQRAAVTRAARQLQSELQANAGAIGAAIDAAEAPRVWKLCTVMPGPAADAELAAGTEASVKAAAQTMINEAPDVTREMILRCDLYLTDPDGTNYGQDAGDGTFVPGEDIRWIAVDSEGNVAEAPEAPRLADTLALRISEMYAQMIDMGAEPHSDYMLTVAAFALQLAQDLALSGAERETFLARAYDDTPHPLGTEYGNPDEPPGAPWVVYPGQPGHSGHSVRPDKARTAWDDMPKTGGFSAGRD